MFMVSKRDILARDKTYSLRDIYERTAAANTLGYDVIVRVDDDGDLIIEYRQRPTVPWQWQ
jgi:hypothetical protein